MLLLLLFTGREELCSGGKETCVTMCVQHDTNSYSNHLSDSHAEPLN